MVISVMATEEEARRFTRDCFGGLGFALCRRW